MLWVLLVVGGPSIDLNSKEMKNCSFNSVIVVTLFCLSREHSWSVKEKQKWGKQLAKNDFIITCYLKNIKGFPQESKMFVSSH